MKKLVFALLLVPFVGYTQKLEENKVDEFTKSTVKRTSWEVVNATMKFTSYFRVSQINNAKYFDLMLMIGGKVFSITQDADLMFKLDNDSIITIKNLKYAITCKGCGARGINGSGAEGVSVSYALADNDATALKEHGIVKIRIYTSDGYVEDEIKPKRAEEIKSAIKLIE